MVRIVASIPVDDVGRAIKESTEALGSGADLVELRLDYLPSIDTADVDSFLASLPPEKCIFTVRSEREGGVRGHANWLKVLTHASNMGAMIDVEAERFGEMRNVDQSRTFVSRHGDLESRYQMHKDVANFHNALEHKGAFVVASLKDVSELVALAREFSSKGVPFSLMGMGPLSYLTRYLLPLYGSRSAYVRLVEPTADGQPSLREYRRAMGSTEISKPEGILCLLGRDIGYTLSPLMHNAALKELGIPWIYVPFDIGKERLSILKEDLSILNIRGLNVTIPYKEEALPLLDSMSPECERIKAVNTITIRDGKLHGYNTDARGFGRALMQKLTPGGVSSLSGLRVMLLGAGGAARAAIYSLMESGAETYVLNRTVSKADSLAKEFGCAMSGGMGLIDVIAGKMDVIVNCTPLTSSGVSPVPQSALLPKHVVMDMVYSPFKTQLLKEAAMRGARTIEGVHMLAHQAALSFELWTDRSIGPDIMLKAGMRVLLGGWSK